MTAKPPTQQGISALLEEAGHARSSVSRRRVNAPGWDVFARRCDVAVRHLHFNRALGAKEAWPHLEDYAATIEAAGWIVRRGESAGLLIVAGPSSADPAWHEDWEADSRDADGNLILRYAPTGGLYRVIPVEG
jgi:hypothetical protein